MKKWEYKTYIRTRSYQDREKGEVFHRAGNWDTFMQDVLDKFGEEGWELVSVVPRSSLAGGTNVNSLNIDLAGFTNEELYVFKRPKRVVKKPAGSS